MTEQPPISHTPYATYPGAPAPQNTSTNGFAIAALIFGIIGGVLLSVIFGIVGLVQIKNRGQKGRGLAITGLVLSGLWIVGIVVGVILLVAADNKKSAPDYTGDISVTRLAVGDCLNGLQETSAVENLPKVPCAGQHEGEVYATFELKAGAFPGLDAVTKQADDGCSDRFKAFSDTDDEAIELFYLHPVESTWTLDRGVTCIATKAGGLTGSLKK
ncbi:DUF4190 domain-containing protein [Actinoplanes sp. NPDC051494]|uniref:DUF4190 domain-containing protein n=1 Tax=Actinoplanes sp. NPDC051494 TaxID=3363907 RepID=UPI0037B83125